MQLATVDDRAQSRLELVSPTIRGSDSAARQLGIRLRACAGVSASMTEPRTGCVVVYYDATRIDATEIRDQLRRSRHLPVPDRDEAIRRERALDGVSRLAPLAVRLLVTALA